MINGLSSLEGKEVEISGWVDTIREHGKLIFLEIRDVTGTVQTIVTAKDAENFETAKSLTKESCVRIVGKVSSRPSGTENKDSSAGNVEVKIQGLEIYNKCSALPFDIDNDEVGEDVRLKYRYLDLRRPEMQRNLILRSKIVRVIRDTLYEDGFNEFETPMLAKSTPEGARDYVVPSRTQPGKFFALPQSPQLFKQLLMVAGFERYFQIARCMRDEDLRSDRQPEFTQLDVEMSFVSQEDIFRVVEGVLKNVFKKVFNKNLKTPFRKMSYEESIKKYKSDKPDLREETKEDFAFTWITDFPLLEYSKDEDRYIACHHPFCMPKNIDDLEKNPEKTIAQSFDLVLNGIEILSGSIRIHKSDIQKKVFDLLKISDKEQKEKFGFLLDALKFGAPPHGGIAIGLDRLIQILTGAESIREVIPFPKNKEAKDLMVDAPSSVSDRQLKDVCIRLDLGKKKP